MAGTAEEPGERGRITAPPSFPFRAVCLLEDYFPSFMLHWAYSSHAIERDVWGGGVSASLCSACFRFLRNLSSLSVLYPPLAAGYILLQMFSLNPSALILFLSAFFFKKTHFLITCLFCAFPRTHFLWVLPPSVKNCVKYMNTWQLCLKCCLHLCC